MDLCATQLFSHLNVGIFSYAIQIYAKSYYYSIVDISGRY